MAQERNVPAGDADGRISSRDCLHHGGGGSQAQPLTSSLADFLGGAEVLEHNSLVEKMEHNLSVQKTEHNPLAEEGEHNPPPEKMEHIPLAEKMEHNPLAEEMEHHPRADKIEHNILDEDMEHNPLAEKMEHNPLAEEMGTLDRETKKELSVTEEEEGGFVDTEREISQEDDEDDKSRSENEGQTTDAFVKQKPERGHIPYQHTIKKRKSGDKYPAISETKKDDQEAPVEQYAIHGETTKARIGEQSGSRFVRTWSQESFSPTREVWGEESLGGVEEDGEEVDEDEVEVKEGEEGKEGEDVMDKEEINAEENSTTVSECIGKRMGKKVIQK